ncbi:MAG: bifunctional 3-(3-hydroxy-phenyl)propionate/3-hydroxycinnamic acid hydroxylase [Pseudodonghicola sp.]
MTEFDVVIVGYGPTGKLLARLLSDEGHSIAVVERWPETYPLPRAIAYFHDTKRMFHAIGMMREISRISRPMTRYQWFNADWQTLIEFNFGGESMSGGPEGYTFSQPDLEDILDRDLQRRGNVAFFKGYEAQAVSQGGDVARVVIRPFDAAAGKLSDQPETTLTARYVVGCDGANSIVRRAMGTGSRDLGFDARWLVVDVKPHDMAAHDIPDAAQWCNPARPTTIVPCGVDKRRWEFMMAPEENEAAFTTDANVWSMIAPWIKPGEGEIIRKAVYNFRSLVADQWRDGRLLLAGDAAHLMPPFMGQGMNSGLRDALTLGFELDLVLKGQAPDSLLDNYQKERADHVESYILLSMEMGKVVCILDEAAAAERDAAFAAGMLPPPPMAPVLTGGLVAMAGAEVAPGAGVLMPHAMLKTPLGDVERLDDLAGRRFFVVTRNGAAAGLGARQRALLARLDASVIDLDGAYAETDGKLATFLDKQGADAVIARPDFHSFGVAAAPQALAALVDELETGLTA